MKKYLVAAAIGALALAPMVSPAATLTGTMAVTATIIPACSAFTAPAIAFGTTIIPSATNVHPATAPTISFTCANTVPAEITLNGGLSPLGAAPSTSRQLKNGTTNFISYDIWQDAFAGTIPWGDGVSATPATCALGLNIVGCGEFVTGTGVAVTKSVYPDIATVPAGTVTGAYTDTVVATLTF